jgi:hypothetical protein
MSDYLLVLFLSVIAGISMGYGWIVVVLTAQLVMVLKFVVEVVEIYLDEPDA